ncbi:MAG: hypothetical protein CSA62_04720 [Planctomycetota bacterium]|nr:MAG: hypothetical protein CSA62_04720 [Planctomycetota bacterium]
MKPDLPTDRSASTPNRLLRSLPLLLASLAACSAPPSGGHVQDALFELDGANYARAYFEVQRALALDPDSPDLQKLGKHTRILALLDQARSLVFEDKEERALAVLAQVRVLDPENPSATRWVAKARTQLGKKKVVEGEEALGSGKLDEALVRFREALELVPGNQAAIRGYRDVGRVFGERRERAELRYRMALRAKLDGNWQRALHHAAIAMAEDPTREDARALVASGERQRADAARLAAGYFEEHQDFAAAARGYMEALELGRPLARPWVAELETRLQHMRREAEAEQLLERFDVELAAGRFREAAKALAEAEKLSLLQKPRINDARLGLIAGQRLQRVEDARLLEVDHRFEDALEIYRELLKERSDERIAIRIARIEDLLETCAELVAQAEKQVKAGEEQRGIETLKQALALYRRYEPAKSMLVELQSPGR